MDREDNTTGTNSPRTAHGAVLTRTCTLTSCDCCPFPTQPHACGFGVSSGLFCCCLKSLLYKFDTHGPLKLNCNTTDHMLARDSLSHTERPQPANPPDIQTTDTKVQLHPGQTTAALTPHASRQPPAIPYTLRP